MDDRDFETQTLSLLIDAQTELSDALNSLGGKKPDGYIDNFKFWSSEYMGHASQGFIVLRTKNGREESRFLVRPTIEIMLKLLAVERRPDSIYRIAFTETRDDQIWLSAVAGHLGKTFDEKLHQTQLQKLKAYCVKHFPSGDFKDSRLSIEQVAILAGEKAFYDSYYRTYCKFTHAALRVIIGSLNDIVSDQDNPTMIRCVLCGI